MTHILQKAFFKHALGLEELSLEEEKAEKETNMEINRKTTKSGEKELFFAKIDEKENDKSKKKNLKLDNKKKSDDRKLIRKKGGK